MKTFYFLVFVVIITTNVMAQKTGFIERPIEGINLRFQNIFNFQKDGFGLGGGFYHFEYESMVFSKYVKYDVAYANAWGMEFQAMANSDFSGRVSVLAGLATANTEGYFAFGGAVFGFDIGGAGKGSPFVGLRLPVFDGYGFLWPISVNLQWDMGIKRLPNYQVGIGMYVSVFMKKE